MPTITLTPEQERFAAEAVAQGRYRDLAAVVDAGLRLLLQAEAERAAFIASLEAAQAEGERDGFFTIDDVEREMDAIIDAAERRRA